jgi:hypothetical protein
VPPLVNALILQAAILAYLQTHKELGVAEVEVKPARQRKLKT